MQAKKAEWRKGRSFAVLCNGLAAIALALFAVGCGVGNPCGDGSVCDDDNPCTTDTCSNGVDTNGEALAVCDNEPVACSNGVCNPEDGECVECVADADCDNDDFCDGEETCSATNACVDGTAPCAEGEFCNEDEDRCDVCEGDADCDDSDGCTADVCSNGQCTNDALDCDDDNLCTTDSCDSNTEDGCVFEPVVCDDGVCNPADGECVECVTAEDCADGELCTDNECVLGADCDTNGDCDDGVFCNGEEVCSNGTCDAGTNPCTDTQVCDEDTDACVDAPDPPVVTVPTGASAQIGQNSVIIGVSVADPDNNTLTVNVEADNGFVAFGTIPAGVTATDALNNAVAANALRQEITLVGTVANLNTTLGSLLYATDRVAGNPGTDDVIITATDINGGSDSETLEIGVGSQLSLTAASDTTLVATELGDLFLATTDTFLGQGDVLNGLGGTDTLQINTIGNALPSADTAAFSVTNIENIFLNGSAGNSSLNMDDIRPASTVTWAPTGAHNLTITNAPDAVTVAVDVRNAASGGNIDLGIEDSTFGSQSFTVQLKGTTGTPLTVPLVTSTLIETLNLNSEGYLGATGVTNTVSSITSSAATINITGSQALVLSSVADLASRTINAATFTGALTLTTAGASTSVTAQGGTGNDNFTGGTGAQAFSGGDGTDTFTGAAGADQLTGGAGVDTFVLNDASAVDIVTDFVAGATGDQFDFDLSNLEGAGATGIDVGEATNFTVPVSGAAVVDTDAITIQELSAAAAAAAGANVFVLTGATFANTGAVETALEVGGTRAMSGMTVVVEDAFIVVYSDGTHAYVAAAFSEVETTDNGVFEATDLTVVNLARINGVTSITAGLFNAANFDFIP